MDGGLMAAASISLQHEAHKRQGIFDVHWNQQRCTQGASTAHYLKSEEQQGRWGLHSRSKPLAAHEYAGISMIPATVH